MVKIKTGFAATVFVCAASTVGWTFVVEGQRGPAAAVAPAGSDWPTYGHDPGGLRYSPLKEITPVNVGELQPAWVYHMKPAGVPPAAPPADPAGDTPPQGRGGRGGRGGAPGGFGAGETT